MHKPGHFPNASVATLHQPMTVFESKILPSMTLGRCEKLRECLSDLMERLMHQESFHDFEGCFLSKIFGSHYEIRVSHVICLPT